MDFLLKGEKTQFYHLCDQCPLPRPISHSLTPNCLVCKQRKDFFDSLAILECLWKEMKERNFFVRLKVAIDEWGSLQTNPCFSGIKNKHNFPFQIIIKTRYKSEGVIHLNLLQSPVVLPTQTHPHEIPNRFDTLLNINVHHLESPLVGIITEFLNGLWPGSNVIVFHVQQYERSLPQVLNSSDDAFLRKISP